MTLTSPEARFVTACLRDDTPVPDATDLDWRAVVHLTVRHRVMAFVLGSPLPTDVGHALRQEMLTSHAVVMLLESELRRVVEAFAGLPVMVLKGPGLARTLYDDPARRPYADLDVSVQRSDESRAVEALALLGYSELPYEPNTGHHSECGFHRLFGGANQRALIELHVDPLQLGVQPVCEAERWQRAVPLPGFEPALMLGPSDQLVTLSVHAHKHGYSRLLWFKDLDLLLRRGAIDWSIVVDAARREGVAASVWYTLQLTRRLLGTPLPAHVDRLRPHWLTRCAYEFVWPTRRVLNLEGYLRRRAVQLFVAESWHGILPSLLLMGRHRARLRIALDVLLARPPSQQPHA
jgi:Uncharacterised nucleotidyltransferase